MSIRIMADGKPYDRTDCREVRAYHKAEPSAERRYRCGVCGAGIHVVHWGTPPFYRHDPGTFWLNDSPRWRR